MKRILTILLILCLLPNVAKAYDFVADGVYYNITSRIRRTVELTHWEEQTGERGKPYRVIHHHNCGHDHHVGEHLSKKHLKLIQMDKDAVERERTAYIGKVTIPATVRHKGIKYRVIGIGDGSFWGRKQLTEVILPQSIEYIGEGAFESCVALREVELPSAVTRIGFAAFRSCAQLSSITLSENLKEMDIYAFSFCKNLPQLTIPKGVETFPGNAVFNCVKLKSITLLHTTPPVIRNNVGLKMNFKNIVFYVPADKLALYKADEFWSKQDVRIINF